MTSSSELSSYFAHRIIGQPKAIEQITPFIQTYRAGLNHPNRPVGVFLLLGPTGTGKTRTVEVLAEALHGNAQRYLRIDCGEFQLDHEVAKLIGAPPGYLGHKESIPLLSKQRLAETTTPQCDLSLVLIDEVEKAAPSLGQLLLGVLDKGRLTLGDSTVVNFDHSLIFLTSNLGAREMMREMAPGFGFDAQPRPQDQWDQLAGKLETIAVAAVRKRFSPEFVNRIDAVITYRPLSEESIKAVLENQIEELQDHINGRLGTNSFNISLNEQARKFLLERGVSLEYGVRELKRVVYRHLTQPLATLVAEAGVTPASTVTVDVSPAGDSLDFDIQGKGTAAARASTPSVLIVDDNRSLLRFLKMVMIRQGWDVATASSAQTALDMIERSRFDVALIDYMLPDSDGAALSAKFKARVPNVEVLLMTGGGAMSFPQNSAMADVPILQKPFLTDDLLHVIKGKLRRKGKGDERQRETTAGST